MYRPGDEETRAETAHGGLVLRGVSKRFGSSTALADVTLEVPLGQYHLVLGGNGAGKTTLAGVVSGLYRPEAGSVWWRGRPLAGGVVAARERGILALEPAPAVNPLATVAENLMLGREPLRFGVLVDQRALVARAAEVLHRLEIAVDPRAPLGGLSPLDQRRVELARAVSRGVGLLVADEPAPELLPWERAHFLEALGALPRHGVAVLLLTGRLPADPAVAHQVTVLRVGRRVASLAGDGLDRATLAELAFGTVPAMPRRTAAPGPPVLAVDWRARRGQRLALRLEVGAGEVVGVTARSRRALGQALRAIGGTEGEVSSALRLLPDGPPLPHARAAVEQGVALVPADRALQALVLQLALGPGYDAGELAALVPPEPPDPVMDGDRFRRLLGNLGGMGMFLGRGGTPRPPSGDGARQLAVLRRWRERRPRAALVEEPTRGLDDAAAAEVLGGVAALAEQGAAVLLFSADPAELASLCHRVVLLGESPRELGGAGLSAQAIAAALSAEGAEVGRGSM